MRLRHIHIMLATTCLAIAGFFSGCGAPPANPTNSGGQNSANVDKSAKTAKASWCSPEHDMQIQKQIVAYLKNDANLWSQKGHLNIQSKYCVVKVHGYTNNWNDFKKLYEIISSVDGIERIDISSMEPPHVTAAAPATCPDDMKQCRQLCIPKDDDCNADMGGEDKDSNSNTAPSRTP